MNIQEALEAKGLKVVDGARRLAIMAELGGTVQLRDCQLDKIWHLTITEGEATVVEAIARLGVPRFPELLVMSKPKAASTLKLEDMLIHPSRIRPAPDDDNSPGM